MRRLPPIQIQTVDDQRGVCLFCGSALNRGSRSREHVLPRWLLRELGIESRIVEPTWASAANGFAIRDQRRQVLSALIHGRVCRGCNNGWMSALEVDARPILLALAAGERPVDALLPDERTLLARWALKTAAALNRSSNFHRLVTDKQARSTRTTALDDDVVVVGHVLTLELDEPFWWLQSAGIALMLFPPGESAHELLTRSQRGAWRVVIAIRRLLLLVAHADLAPGWRMFIEPELHTPIWPLTAAWGQRVGTPRAFERIGEAAFFFSQYLGLMPTGAESAMDGIFIESFEPDP